MYIHDCLFHLTMLCFYSKTGMARREISTMGAWSRLHCVPGHSRIGEQAFQRRKSKGTTLMLSTFRNVHRMDCEISKL